MRTFALLCLWLLLSGFTPGQQVVALNPQVRPDNASAGLPAVDDNWAVAGYPYAGGTCAEWGHRVPCYQHQSTTRASTAYCTALDGLLFNVATGVLRQCAWNGALIEEARTNIALWSRDYTNAVWVKVNVTAALTATGPDNSANSASLLTATAANGTILQTITIASAQRALSVYVQRVTGSGAINVSQDGVSWTALTSANCVLPGTGVASGLVTAGYVKCVLVATQLNPVIGFQIVTSGDAINVDFTGLEAGASYTSAIATTTVSVTRAADNTTLTNAALAAINAPAVSVVVAFSIPFMPSSLTSPRVFDQNSGATGMFVGSGPTNTQLSSLWAAAALPTSTTYTIGSMSKGGVTLTSGAQSAALNGAGQVFGVSATAISTGAVNLGNRSAMDRPLNGSIQRFTVYKTVVPTATILGLSQP